MRTVTCKKCGWIHMAQSRNEIEENINSFLEYIKEQPLEVQENFGISDFSTWNHVEQKMWNRQMRCFNCGEYYTNFRDATEDDGPGYPVTIQSIMDWRE